MIFYKWWWWLISYIIIILICFGAVHKWCHPFSGIFLNRKWLLWSTNIFIHCNTKPVDCGSSARPASRWLCNAQRDEMVTWHESHLLCKIKRKSISLCKRHKVTYLTILCNLQCVNSNYTFFSVFWMPRWTDWWLYKIGMTNCFYSQTTRILHVAQKMS